MLLVKKKDIKWLILGGVLFILTLFKLIPWSIFLSLVYFYLVAQLKKTWLLKNMFGRFLLLIAGLALFAVIRPYIDSDLAYIIMFDLSLLFWLLPFL